MSTPPPPRPDAGGATDRVRCAYCGANNFPASPTCWQCGRPLRPLSANTPAASQAAPAWPAASSQSHPITSLDAGLAPKAAAALGLLFPWAGLPIGIAFLMLDDPRKAKLGWIAIGWSIAGTVLNVLLFALPLLGLLPMLKSLFGHPGGIPGGGGIPNLPPLGGGE